VGVRSADGRGQAPPLHQSQDATVQLLSPAENVDLIAGASAQIAWQPLAAYRELPAVEEWEAFLSLDGGATFPWRLTPHLDQDVRRIAFRVPPLASSDARLLLRIGDERRETPVLLPQRFVIRAAAAAPALTAALDAGRLDRAHFDSGALVASAPGEPALPGQHGVLAWVDGSRRGEGLRQVVAGAGASLTAALTLTESQPILCVLSAATAHSEIAAPRAIGAAVPPTPASARAPALVPARPCPDLLLLTQRQNE
jgi:hypothetical protein